MPCLGYGIGTAWFNGGGKAADHLATCLHNALDAGLLHIDEVPQSWVHELTSRCMTQAEMYNNETATGEAFQAWLTKGNSRDSVFITSKILNGIAGGIEVSARYPCTTSHRLISIARSELYPVKH